MSLVPSSPGELTLLRLFPFWVKRCRNGLKFDVEPSSGILGPTMSYVFWVRVSGFTTTRSSCSTARRVKLDQIMSKWPETSCVLFLLLSWRILQFFFLFWQDLIFEAAMTSCGRKQLHVASWCQECMKRQSDIFGVNRYLHDCTSLTYYECLHTLVITSF